MGRVCINTAHVYTNTAHVCSQCLILRVSEVNLKKIRVEMKWFMDYCRIFANENGTSSVHIMLL